MEDSRKNKEDRQLWSYFKKAGKSGNVPCLDDNSLAAYIDGKLSAGKRGLMEEHFSACPHCLQKLMQMRSLLGVGLEEAPYQLRQKVKGFVSQDSREKDEGEVAWWQFLFQPPKSLAWGVVILLVILTGVKSGEVIAFSPVMGGHSVESNNLVESTLDLLGLQDNGVI